MNDLTPQELSVLLTKHAEPDDDPSNYNVPAHKPLRKTIEKVIPVAGAVAGAGIAGAKALTNLQYRENRKFIS